MIGLLTLLLLSGNIIQANLLYPSLFTNTLPTCCLSFIFFKIFCAKTLSCEISPLFAHFYSMFLEMDLFCLLIISGVTTMFSQSSSVISWFSINFYNYFAYGVKSNLISFCSCFCFPNMFVEETIFPTLCSLAAITD